MTPRCSYAARMGWQLCKTEYCEHGPKRHYHPPVVMLACVDFAGLPGPDEPFRAIAMRARHPLGRDNLLWCDLEDAPIGHQAAVELAYQGRLILVHKHDAETVTAMVKLARRPPPREVHVRSPVVGRVYRAVDELEDAVCAS